jgi:probable phosphoglycerate mutase
VDVSSESLADETRVLLVRHGETDWNRAGRIQGWAPTALTDRGREQARRLGRHLAANYDIDRVVSSDLRRTRETTALLREQGVDPDPAFRSAWRERNFGHLQGLTAEELFEQFPEYAATSGAFAARTQPPGGERLLDLYERVVADWERVCDGAAGETVLVVTHGGPIYVTLGHVRGMDLLSAVLDHSQDNCALNELRAGETTEILRQNETV